MAAALFAGAARADDPAPADVAAGLRLFRTKANCQACHGWAGDGRKLDTQMPDGANLRETQLDRDAIIKTIQCGRPGQGMPAFDRQAYSDGRCYGMKAADLEKSGLTLTDPPSYLAAREINFIVDFLFAKVVGKGAMNHAACVEFWGSDVAACKEFPD
jgi:Cytochrome C oxidase, cbb3-type, subunit III